MKVSTSREPLFDIFNIHICGISALFERTVVRREMWGREGTTCSTGPGPGIEPRTLQ